MSLVTLFSALEPGPGALPLTPGAALGSGVSVNPSVTFVSSALVNPLAAVGAGVGVTPGVATPSDVVVAAQAAVGAGVGVAPSITSNNVVMSSTGTGAGVKPTVTLPTGNIAHVQDSPANTNASGFPVTLTLPNLPGPTNWLTVVIGGASSSAVPVFAVSGGGVGTWNRTSIQSALSVAQVWYGEVTGTPSTTVTVSLTSGNTSLGQQCIASEWSGIVGAFSDNAGATGTSTTAAPGSVSPSANAELFIAAYGNAASFISTPTGWTGLGALDHSGIGAWQIDSVPVNPSVNINTSNTWAACIQGFSPISLPAIPQAPTGVTAVAGNAQVTVGWTPPSVGAIPTTYTVLWTSSAGNGSKTGLTGTSAPITGLTNGVTYTFTVEGVTTAGAGPASSPGVPATPTGVAPGALNVVIQSSGQPNSISPAQWSTMHTWGVGSTIMSTNYPPGFGGIALYASGNSGTLSATAQAWQADAVKAHAANVKCLLEFSLENYFFSPSSGSGAIYNSNPAPCLGGWNPAFTDGNGHGWGGNTVPYTANSWNAVMYSIGQAIATMNLDGLFWDTEGGEIGPQHQVTVTGCSCTNGSKAVSTTQAGGFSGAGIVAGSDVSGTGLPGGNGLSAVSGSTATLDIAATSTQSNQTWTFTIPSASYIIWGWRYYFNYYGATSTQPGYVGPNLYLSTQSQEATWAQQRGFDMMTAINRGYHAAGGNSAIGVGNDVPVYLYASAGFNAQFPGNYTDVNETFQGATRTEFHGGVGDVTVSFHQLLLDNVWQNFIIGCAQASAAPIVCGNSYFYSCGAVINNTNIYYTDADGGWARALAADQTAMTNLHNITGITTPTNLKATPMLWILDSTGGNSPGGPTWTQAQWNQAIGPIITSVTNSGVNAYCMYDQTGFPNAITSTSNYADNTNAARGGTGQNYTPLNS